MSAKNKLTERAFDAIKLGRIDILKEGQPFKDTSSESGYAYNAPTKHGQSLTFHFTPPDSQRAYLGVLCVYAPTEEEVVGNNLASA
jgi:hypothetical protein